MIKMYFEATLCKFQKHSDGTLTYNKVNGFCFFHRWCEILQKKMVRFIGIMSQNT